MCRANWNLESKRGPQGLEDRHNEQRLNYLGGPLVYTYYDKELFLDELHFFGDTISPANATERQFEEALQRTSTRIQQRWISRSLTEEYQGPPSYVHRGNAAQMDFMLESPAQGAPPTESQNAMNWLQCHECSVWRRVDLQTLRSYSTALYREQGRLQRREQLITEYPSLKPYLSERLRRRRVEFEAQHALPNAPGGLTHSPEPSGLPTSSTPPAALNLSCDDLMRILSAAESCKLRALAQDSDQPTKRAVFELCSELCSKSATDAAEIDDACLLFDDEEGGPVFRCSSLVACTCSIPCDVATASTAEDGYHDYRAECREPLVLRNAQDPDQEYSVAFHCLSLIHI